jgi:hypothetical protein
MGLQPTQIYDDNGNPIFMTPCTPPAGTANVTTNCGEQIGDNFKTTPRTYLNEANLVGSVLVQNFQGGDGQLYTVNTPLDWNTIDAKFTISDPLGLSPGILLSANQACDAANLLLSIYLTTHKGTPGSTFVNQVISSCSGNKSTPTSGSNTVNAVNKFIYGPK